MTNYPLPTEVKKRGQVHGLTLSPSAKKKFETHVLAAGAGMTSCCGTQDDYQVLTGQNIKTRLHVYPFEASEHSEETIFGLFNSADKLWSMTIQHFMLFNIM